MLKIKIPQISGPVAATRDLFCKLIRRIGYADLFDVDLIAVISGNRLELYVTLDGNAEGEYLVALLSCEFFTVDVESDLGAV